MAQTQQLTSLFILVCSRQPEKKKKKKDISAGFFFRCSACMQGAGPRACMSHVHHTCHFYLSRQKAKVGYFLFGFTCVSGGIEESACCPQETVLTPWQRGGRAGRREVVVGGGGQPSRTINRKLKGCEGGGGVKKAFRTRGHLHNVHIDCYLQVQQSFKFPVE